MDPAVRIEHFLIEDVTLPLQLVEPGLGLAVPGGRGKTSGSGRASKLVVLSLARRAWVMIHKRREKDKTKVST